MKLDQVKGLNPESRRKVCGVGNPNQPRCMFLRYVNCEGEFRLLCAKGTEAGTKHAEKIRELLKENPDGKLSLFDGKMEIIAADNCPGMSG